MRLWYILFHFNFPNFLKIWTLSSLDGRLMRNNIVFGCNGIDYSMRIPSFLNFSLNWLRKSSFLPKLCRIFPWLNINCFRASIPDRQTFDRIFFDNPDITSLLFLQRWSSALFGNTGVYFLPVISQVISLIVIQLRENCLQLLFVLVIYILICLEITEKSQIHGLFGTQPPAWVEF